MLTFAWNFSTKDMKRLTPYQQMILDISYQVGEEERKGLGIDIAAIALVETTFGIQNRNNHICGAHQIDVRYVPYTCDEVNSNPVLSARLAVQNFLNWEYGKTSTGKVFKRTISKQHRMYNVGYLNDQFQWTHYKKILKAKQLIKNYVANNY